MRKNDPIAHIMTDQVLSVQQGQPVSAVLKLVHDNSIHHVPVVDGETLVGIISSTDLMKLTIGTQGLDTQSMWSYFDTQFSLADIMTEKPQTLSENGTVRDAADALSDGAYHSLPVVNDAGELKGIVTATDLIRYLCDQY